MGLLNNYAQARPVGLFDDIKNFFTPKSSTVYSFKGKDYTPQEWKEFMRENKYKWSDEEEGRIDDDVKPAPEMNLPFPQMDMPSMRGFGGLPQGMKYPGLLDQVEAGFSKDYMYTPEFTPQISQQQFKDHYRDLDEEERKRFLLQMGRINERYDHENQPFMKGLSVIPEGQSPTGSTDTVQIVPGRPALAPFLHSGRVY